MSEARTQIIRRPHGDLLKDAFTGAKCCSQCGTRDLGDPCRPLAANEEPEPVALHVALDALERTIALDLRTDPEPTVFNLAMRQSALGQLVRWIDEGPRRITLKTWRVRNG